MLLSVVEFSQVLPFRFHPLLIFLLISIEICQEIELISMTYVIMLLSWKKLVKLLKIALLGPYLDKNWVSMGRTQNQVQCFYGNTKRRSKALKNFLFSQNMNIKISKYWAETGNNVGSLSTTVGFELGFFRFWL